VSNPIVYMLTGLPSSGKSTWSKDNAEKLNAVVLSSDNFREQWYGDANIQGDGQKIFNYIYLQAKIHMDLGKSVIIDATNTSRKRRIHFNKEFKDYERHAIYFDSPPNACILRDSVRDRVVGKNVIMRMYKNLQVPLYCEGWNNIQIIHEKTINPFHSKEYFEQKLLNGWEYQDMFSIVGGLGEFNDFMNIHELPHDNPHHTFSVSRHTYYVYKYIHNNYEVALTTIEDLVKMLWAGVFHDVGKGRTKTFVNPKGEKKRYASYYSHENCSGQIACKVLHALGYDDDFILGVVELVNLHMKLLNAETEKSLNKIKNLVSESTFKNLEFLHTADISAK
jgi:predicted kinase